MLGWQFDLKIRKEKKIQVVCYILLYIFSVNMQLIIFFLSKKLLPFSF